MYGLQGAALKAYMDSLLADQVAAIKKRLLQEEQQARTVEALERIAAALEKLTAMQPPPPRWHSCAMHKWLGVYPCPECSARHGHHWENRNG